MARGIRHSNLDFGNLELEQHTQNLQLKCLYALSNITNLFGKKSHNVLNSFVFSIMLCPQQQPQRSLHFTLRTLLSIKLPHMFQTHSLLSLNL
ncbi:hypothetical protein RIF29_17472 [Crotalaria pallida]|uniref:Uncharacterized protein n=1 Tax=Crotalaria pallida TaxID=3830 RepID=A0AAN9FQU6_CROPI